MGSVLAYLPVFLEHRLGGLDRVGLVMSTTGLAVILTPVIMTALADTRLQSRSLIAVLFAIASVTCVWQAMSDSFTALMISHAVFAFFFWPLSALQDGLVFADNQQAAAEGRATTPYHRTRLYGTFGFAMPLGALYFLLRGGMDPAVALYLGAGVCALGAVNALTLPHTALGTARRARFEVNDDAAARRRLPTLAAASVLFRGPALLFCIFMFIAHLGNSAYYAFYPVYLTQTIGFGKQWVGPIIMLGVLLEVGVMASVGSLTARLGLKWLLIVGLSFMVLRYLLLGVLPNTHVAVWTQVLHGTTVVGIYVLPPIYLNTLAADHFRSSIHGLYAMTVFGPARILGNILGGELSNIDLPMMFNVMAATTLLAVIGLALGMRVRPESTSAAQNVPPLVEGD